MRHVALIGLRRAGKSVVGRLLAAALGRSFVDVDVALAEATGLTPARWLRERGEAPFRDVEAATLAALLDAPTPAVIATGGGAPLREASRRALAARATVVYLRVDPWILAARAARDPDPAARPILVSAAEGDREPYVHFAERDALYRTTCDAVVEASGTPEAALAAALERLAILGVDGPAREGA
ncbi:MAG TPA: shikimate kinase [Planctomycetota bacterium]|nr:shikimate kinase [Planctomycetota bacterium]